MTDWDQDDLWDEYEREIKLRRKLTAADLEEMELAEISEEELYGEEYDGNATDDEEE